MSGIVSRFTVYFEDPFWVGVYERTCGTRYEVTKITFGGEPKDAEVYEFMLNNWDRLRFGVCAGEETPESRRVSPKRMQRVIQRQLHHRGAETKAQQALKLVQEQMKTERKTATRQQREAEKDEQFEQKQQKRKEKHRGR